MAYEPLFDFLKSKKKEGEPEPEQASDMRTVSNERSLLAGATPLLVGLLSGNVGSGLEVASKGLMAEDQRALSEQKSLMDHIRKKNLVDAKVKADAKPEDLIGKGIVPVWDTQDKRVRNVSRADSLNNRFKPASYATESQGALASTKADIDKSKQFAIGDRYGRGVVSGKDPITDENILTNKATGEVIKAKTSTSELTPRQVNKLPAIQKEFDSSVKVDTDAMKVAGDARALLNSNPSGQQAAVFKIARMINGTGVLTDNDVRAVTGERSWKELLAQYFEKSKTGTLTGTNFDHLAQIVDILEERSKKSIVEKRDRFVSSRSKPFGKDISEYLPFGKESNEVAKKGNSVELPKDTDLDKMTNDELTRFINGK